MIRALALCAFLSASCAAPMAVALDKHETRHGLIVSTLDGARVDPQEIEEVTEIFLEDAVRAFGLVSKEALRGYIVEFVKGPFWCGTLYVHGGCHWRDARKIQVILYDRCLAKTSFAHELTHALETEIKGFSSHVDPSFWSLRWGLLGRVNHEAVVQTCQESVGFVR